MFNGMKYDLIIVEDIISPRLGRKMLKALEAEFNIVKRPIEIIASEQVPNLLLAPINKPWYRQKMKY